MWHALCPLADLWPVMADLAEDVARHALPHPAPHLGKAHRALRLPSQAPHHACVTQ
jgi:hypothetical protein